MKSNIIGAVALAAALATPAAVLAETLPASLSPVRATLLGTVNFSALASSKSNAAALAALASAKPKAPLPRLLPNGKPLSSLHPALSSLPHPAANVALAAGSGPVSVSGFTGIYEGTNAAANGSELEPPDQGLAVNNGVVGEIVNNTIQFFQSGKPLTSPVANSMFFNSGTVANLSDPHIEFDPSVQRWFVDELTYSGPLGYGFFIAVSTTSNPLGSYNVYFVDGSASDVAGCSGGCLPDYPQVGYDANGYYITADLFGSSFVSAAIWGLPKAALVAGQSFTPVRFLVPDFVVEPAIPARGEPFSLANGGTEYFLTARNIYDNSTNIRVWEVQNTFNIATAPSTLVAVKYTLRGEAYGPTVPSTQPNVVGPLGKSVGATAAPMLDGGYDSFGSGVKLARGRLYAALTSGATDSTGFPRDIAAWFVVNVSGSRPYVAKQGYIVPPDGYSISYPGMALNKLGYGYVGVSITSPKRNAVGGYPSTAVIPFVKEVPGAITVTGVGGASDDGFTGYAYFGGGGVGRWGDYASATVDPATGIFYTANEFIPDPAVYPRGVFANWGTFVTSVKGLPSTTTTSVATK